MDSETEKKVRHYILIKHETFWQSIVTDTYTFLVVVGVIGIGWWLGSSAMQWTGFAMLAIACLTKIVGETQKFKTITEARQFLDEIEAKNRSAPVSKGLH